MTRDYTDPPAPQLFIKRGPTEGEIYLMGFGDGYHARPRVIQRTKKAQAAYARGYEVGISARQAPQQQQPETTQPETNPPK